MRILGGLEKRKVLMCRHLRLEHGEVVFKIDPSLQVFREDASHQILLNKRLASQKGQLVVLWGDRIILRTNLKRETDITEELIRVLSGELELIAPEALGLEYQA
jgi:hypothetical protein